MKKFYQNVVIKARIGNLSMTMAKLHNKKGNAISLESYTVTQYY